MVCLLAINRKLLNFRLFSVSSVPIYEYECLQSGHRFDEWQKIDAPPLQVCKVCGAKVRKLISRTSFLLKGGGWYKDGYASSNGSKSGTDSGKSGTKPDSGTKSESSSGSGSSESKNSTK